MVYVFNGSYSYMIFLVIEFLYSFIFFGVFGVQIVYFQVEEQQFLVVGSFVVSCLLEGFVWLGFGSVLQYCYLWGFIYIGVGCMVSGLDIVYFEVLYGWELYDFVLQGYCMWLYGFLGYVFIFVGCLDSWERQGVGIYFNVFWSEFFKRIGV